MVSKLADRLGLVGGEILSMYTNNLIEGGLIPPQVAVAGRLAAVLYFGVRLGILVIIR